MKIYLIKQGRQTNFLNEFEEFFDSKQFKKTLREEGYSREFAYIFTDGKRWYAVIHSEGKKKKESTSKISKDYLALKRKHFSKSVFLDLLYNVKA